jgi:hypothetical protein
MRWGRDAVSYRAAGITSGHVTPWISQPIGFFNRTFPRCYPQAPAPLPKPATVTPPYGGAKVFCTACRPSWFFTPREKDDIEDHHTQDLVVAFHRASCDTQFPTAGWPGTPSNDSTSTVPCPPSPNPLEAHAPCEEDSFGWDPVERLPHALRRLLPIVLSALQLRHPFHRYAPGPPGRGYGLLRGGYRPFPPLPTQ